MYRRPKFLEKLLDVRREMSREADYDVIAFSQIVRTNDGRVTARTRPVTRVITTDDNKLTRITRPKSKKRTAVKK